MKNFESYISAFREWMQAKGLSKDTSIETYCSGVCSFLSAFPTETSPKNINQQQIIRFLGTIVSPHTRKSVYYSTKLFYEVIIRQPNKFDHIPPPDIPKSLPVILTLDEVYKIIDSKKKNIKHQTLLQLIYSGGLRRSEPIAVKQHHISKQYEPMLQKDIVSLHIVEAKGDKDRIIPLPLETYNLIESYKQEVKPVDYLFNGWKNEPQYSEESIGQVFKQAIKFCGITKDVTPHSLRHSRATHLLDAGYSLPYLMKFLGHENIDTTMIYVHCSHVASARMLHSADEYLSASFNKTPLNLFEHQQKIEGNKQQMLT